jgi:hypothetical protein
MRVITPAIKLDVRIEKVGENDGLLSFNGIAGTLPCETTLKPSEMRQLLKLALKPSVLKLLFCKDPVQNTDKKKKG